MKKNKKIAFLSFDLKKFDVSSVRLNYFIKRFCADNSYQVSVISNIGEYNIIFFFKKLFFSDVFVVSFPPFASMLIHIPFLIMSRIFNTRLVIDFRDPWSFNIGSGYCKNDRFGNIKFSFKYIVACFFEQIFIIISNKFIVTTEGMYDYYSKFFLIKNKLFLVENGYDEAQMPVNNEKFNDNFVRILFAGKLFEYCEEETIDIVNFISSNLINRKLIFECACSSEEYLKLTSMDIPNSEFLFHGIVNYTDFIKIGSRCDVGVVTVRCDNMYYGTKLFDYIGLKLVVISSFTKNSQVFKKFSSYPLIYDLNNSTSDSFDFNLFMTKRNSHLDSNLLFSRDYSYRRFKSIIDVL